VTRIFDIILSIFLIPIKLIQYIVRGFSILFKGLAIIGEKILIVLNRIRKDFVVGCTWVCVKVYYFFKYALVGFSLPFVLLTNLFNDIYDKIIQYEKELDARKKREEEERKRKKAEEIEKRAEKIRLAEEARQAQMKALQERNDKLKEEAEKAREEAKPKDDLFYKNEEVDIGKKGLGGMINTALETIISFPSKWVKSLKKSVGESALKKQLTKEKDVNRQALLIDFEGEDADKAEKKLMWEYVCKTSEGKTVKGYFAAYSRLEVHSFLMSEGMTIYSIRTNKWIQTMYSSVNGNGAKIKKKDLVFFLTQLSTYIKSGIPLVDAMSILTRQFKNKNYQRMFRAMMYDLVMGESFSKAMENQGESFPPILINMVKSSELTGELPESLDDMAEYFTAAEEARKEMISAMTYPCIVFLMAIGVSIFMMVYIVPQFAEIYTSMDASSVPKFTLMVLKVSDFLKAKLLWIIIVLIASLFLIIYLFRNVKVIRTMMQWGAMHIPVMGNIIIYNEVTMFSKTFSSLLSHNVFITDSMNVLRKITNNEIYKLMILDTVNNLASGEKISTAFKDHWAFPIPAYEMIVTGEKTGQLAEMMAKVSNYYQGEHKNMVARVKALLEPIIIVFLTAIVGVIVLAIVVPMFSMYSVVQTM
jgi:Type II secretory pathway, component PulF